MDLASEHIEFTGGFIMELYTLASAAELVGCSPSRLKGWMEKGLIPERRIHFGRVRARVIEEASIPKIKRVLEGIDQQGLNIRKAFEHYFNQEEEMEN
jgi:DNA-binding transcriptional MerR regulator